MSLPLYSVWVFLLLGVAVSAVVFNEDVDLFYIFQILCIIGTEEFIQVLIVVTTVFVLVFYFTIILCLYFLSFMCVIAVVVSVVLAFLTSIVMIIPPKQKLVIEDSSLLYPLLLSRLKATGTTNIPILFVFMICISV